MIDQRAGGTARTSSPQDPSACGYVCLCGSLTTDAGVVHLGVHGLVQIDQSRFLFVASRLLMDLWWRGEVKFQQKEEGKPAMTQLVASGMKDASAFFLRTTSDITFLTAIIDWILGDFFSITIEAVSIMFRIH